MTEPASAYRKYRFSYRFDGTDWTIDIPALSLEEAKDRVKVLGFARYEGEKKRRRKRDPNGHGSSSWFRKALRGASLSSSEAA